MEGRPHGFRSAIAIPSTVGPLPLQQSIDQPPRARMIHVAQRASAYTAWPQWSRDGGHGRQSAASALVPAGKQPAQLDVHSESRRARSTVAPESAISTNRQSEPVHFACRCIDGKASNCSTSFGLGSTTRCCQGTQTNFNHRLSQHGRLAEPADTAGHRGAKGVDPLAYG